MSSVNTSFLRGLFRPASQGGYDIDGNGVLDRPELAKASLNLLGRDNPNAQAAGSALATFVQGGKDGKGLLPDYNGDNALSLQELNRFANGSPTISAQNFQQTFGNRYQAGGNSLNINGLKSIAEGNLGKYNNVDANTLGSLGIYGNPPQPQGNYGAYQPSGYGGFNQGGMYPQFLNMMQNIFGLMSRYFGRNG